MNKVLSVAIGMALLLNTLPALSEIADSPRYKTMGAALDALKKTNDEGERARIYSDIGKVPLETPEQLTALYDEVASMESRVKGSNEKQYVGITQYLSRTFSTATDPKYSSAIAAILKKEYDSMPSDFIGPYGAKQEADIQRFEMRRARLQALTEVAGKAADRDALPTLRKMVESKGLARDYAVSAIGRIGDPADLEDFIQRIKRDPKAHINVNSFGPPAVDRVVQEIENPSASPAVRGVFTNGLRYMASHDNIPRYRKLLAHANHSVREMAADGICRVAQPGDEEAIIGIARDSSNMYQLQAFRAMNRMWSAQFIPVLRDVLFRDPDPIIRAEAARTLGTHKVREAAQDLLKAKNDREGEVRRAAEEALKILQ